jgi:peptidylprolyl isomerase domain and WD repeat-containing protein 1
LADKAVRDPTLFCTALKRQRFYMFTRSEPEYVPVSETELPTPVLLTPGLTPRFCRESSSKSGDRDIFNERPTREEQSIAAAAPAAASSRTAALASSATIHTTLGDMHLRLFPQQAPKAVENFMGHARNAYYDGVIFHRVIPKFMVQTGDPLGDGTGGTSIWDHEFEDEFSEDLKHDRYVKGVLGLFQTLIAQSLSPLPFFFFFSLFAGRIP